MFRRGVTSNSVASKPRLTLPQRRSLAAHVGVAENALLTLEGFVQLVAERDVQRAKTITELVLTFSEQCTRSFDELQLPSSLRDGRGTLEEEFSRLEAALSDIDVPIGAPERSCLLEVQQALITLEQVLRGVQPLSPAILLHRSTPETSVSPLTGEVKSGQESWHDRGSTPAK